MFKEFSGLLKIKIIFLVSLFTFFILNINLHAAKNDKPLKIVHFYSNNVGFWPLSTNFAKAAAEDLNIEFSSYSYALSPLLQIELVSKVLNDPKTKPDGFIFHNYKRKGEQILKIAQKANVPAIMFNAGPTPEDTIGNPREKYPLYLGLITPDDEKAGYDLAINLIKVAKEKALRGKDGKIHLCVMEGSRSSNAAKLRRKGLLRAVKEDKEVVIDQFFDTKWRKKQAQEAFRVAVKRYPEAKVFWSASDSMALGILKEAQILNKKPNIDFITGGVDLLPSIQNKVLNGEVAVSIGAHYTESIWALVLLHDYLRGCDFKKEGKSPIYKSTMLTLTSKNKPIPLKETEEEILEWGKTLDFSKYSKCYSQKEYLFEVSEFFK